MDHIDCMAEVAERVTRAGDTHTILEVTKQLADFKLRMRHLVKDLLDYLLNTDQEQPQRWMEHFSVVFNCVIDDTIDSLIISNP